MKALALAMLAMPLGGVVIPAGTHVPIRFLRRITSGRDTAGTEIVVQTLGALARDSCVVVPPYARVRGRLVRSQGGGWFGGHGLLRVAFDSLEVRPGRWAAISGTLDTLEYGNPVSLEDSGLVSSGHASPAGVGRRIAPAGVAMAAGFAAPAAALTGYALLHRGPPVRIVAGEVGDIRLTEPLVVAGGDGCHPVASRRELAVQPPALPRFVPRTENRAGTRLGDPFNLLLLGDSAEIDAAFRSAGWLRPRQPSLGAVAQAVTAAIADRPAAAAPMSTQYFEGRPQALAYELPGPNARVRHHVRIWPIDSLATVWVGAANEDVGVIFKPWKLKVTHRIDEHIDRERDLIVHELDAGGCADVADYVTLPGAVREGRNVAGQRIVSDGRAAVVRLGPCERLALP